MKLLRIDSSARDDSVSRRLTSCYVEAWRKAHPTGEAIDRDLAATPIPPITDEWIQGVYTDSSKLTAAQQRALAASDALIEKLVSADTIVIGTPMHDFTVSSMLKAWIDQVVRPGKTFAYGPNGRKGLLGGKRVVCDYTLSAAITLGRREGLAEDELNDAWRLEANDTKEE